MPKHCIKCGNYASHNALRAKEGPICNVCTGTKPTGRRKERVRFLLGESRFGRKIVQEAYYPKDAS